MWLVVLESINQVADRLPELESYAEWEDCKPLDKQNYWSWFIKKVWTSWLNTPIGKEDTFWLVRYFRKLTKKFMNRRSAWQIACICLYDWYQVDSNSSLKAINY